MNQKNISFDLDKPYDKYQIATEISCSNTNCKFPNVCLNQNTCGCANSKANFFIKDFSSPATYEVFCNYERKDPRIVSLLEIFFPGVGFMTLGHTAYGIFKLLAFLALYTLIFLKLSRGLEKDKLPQYTEHKEYVEYKKDFHFYLTFAAYGICVIWIAIDLILIGLGVTKDSNGVHLIILDLLS